MNSNGISSPCEKIPIEKLVQFSKENQVYIIVLVNTTGERILIEKGVYGSYPDDETARRACGLYNPTSLLVNIKS